MPVISWVRIRKNLLKQTGYIFPTETRTKTEKGPILQCETTEYYFNLLQEHVHSVTTGREGHMITPNFC